MKHMFILAAMLVATTSLTACMDTIPGQYPPSMSMERDSMPDKVDQRNIDKAEQTNQKNER